MILSACDTGGGDGSGQGLSGLARAFFFAGAKALLVSHWSVDDRATQALMTEVFQLFGQNSNLSKSAALRDGMLKVMDQGKEVSFPYFSHPYSWAPFFLVGEGARQHKAGLSTLALPLTGKGNQGLSLNELDFP